MQVKKACTKCKKSKKLSFFYNKSKYSTETRKWCKQCCRTKNDSNKREWRNIKIVMRPCIGPMCRGEKIFKSFGGFRLCVSCRVYNKTHGDMSDIAVIEMKRSR